MTRLVLLAGASGSGKSRLAHATGGVQLRLDDFYLDHDAPGLPHRDGRVDWDDAATWDGAAAVEALRALAETGRSEVPLYSIAESRRTGAHVLQVAPDGLLIAEGIFAVDLLPLARAAGLPVQPLFLDRPRTLVAGLRFVRDVRQHRKPVPVLLRRGVALWRQQPALRRRALAAGFAPVTMRQALALLRG